MARGAWTFLSTLLWALAALYYNHVLKLTPQLSKQLTDDAASATITEILQCISIVKMRIVSKARLKRIFTYRSTTIALFCINIKLFQLFTKHKMLIVSEINFNDIWKSKKQINRVRSKFAEPVIVVYEAYHRKRHWPRYTVLQHKPRYSTQDTCQNFSSHSCAVPGFKLTLQESRSIYTTSFSLHCFMQQKTTAIITIVMGSSCLKAASR